MKRLMLFLLSSVLLVLWSMPLYGSQRGLSKPVSLATPFVNGVFRALIIGNNEYKDPEGLWVPLKTPVADAEVIAHMLRKHYGFSPENIIILKNATRSEILAAFSKMAKISKENDSVFIYYAGHGFADPDTKEAFWIPVDVIGKEDYTYVRNSTIKSKLAVIADHAKHVFLVSDSCFSGTLLREGHRGIRHTERNDQYYRKVARKKSVQILAAGGLEYVDDDYKGTGHSPFTYFFLKQLEQNTERYFSATEISLEVTKAVSKNVFQTPEKGILHGAGDNNGDFFFVSARALPATEPSVKAPSAVGQKAEIFDAEAEMWALVKDSNNIEDIKSFLASFPNGRLTPVAQLKLKQLERIQKRGQKPEQTVKEQVASLNKPSEPGSGIKLAIFPGSFKNHGKKAYKKVMHVIGDFIDESELFSQIFSFYNIGSNLNIITISRDIRKKRLWNKKEFFSPPEPDIDTITKEAKLLGVDAVLMYYLNVDKGGSHLIVYLIDVDRKKQYKEDESLQFWKMDGPSEIRKLTGKVVADYKKDNR